MKRPSISALLVLLTACSPPPEPAPPPTILLPPTSAAPEPAPAPPKAPELPALRFDPIGAVPAREGDEITLFTLDHHIAAAFQDSAAPREKVQVRLVVSDGAKLVTDRPLEAPGQVASILAMAGDWPRRVEVLASGKKPTGETSFETLGHHLADGRWTPQKLGWALAKVGEHVLTVEHPGGKPTQLRAIQGGPAPRATFTPRAKDECPEQGTAVDTKLFPRALVALGAALATVGETCDARLGVELFPASGGKGSIHLADGDDATITDAQRPQIAARGAELWAVRRRVIHRFDGKAWSKVALPAPDAILEGAAVDGAGALWLLDRGALVERKGDAFIAYAKPPEPATALVTGPGGDVIILAGRRLYRVRR